MKPDKVEVMLQSARDGNLGTPEKPHRGSSLHHAFWAGYFGHRKPSDYPRTSASYYCAKAGVIWRDEA